MLCSVWMALRKDRRSVREVPSSNILCVYVSMYMPHTDRQGFVKLRSMDTDSATKNQTRGALSGLTGR